MTIGATLIQATNLILLVANSNADIRKFVVWRKNGNDLQEVLQGLEITRISIEDDSKTFEHPIETGAVIADYRIVNPKRASLQAYISINDTVTLKELEYLYLSGAELKIRANNNVINKIMISSKPFEITGSIFDKSLYSISLKEFFEVTPTYVNMPPKKVAKKSNASRVNSGQKQAVKKQKSWAYSALWGGRT